MSGRGKRNDRWLRVAEEESAQLIMGQDSNGNPVDYVQMDDLERNGTRKSDAVRALEARPFSARKHRGLYFMFGGAIMMILIFVALSAAGRSSDPAGPRRIAPRSNGTHIYNPTTILISLDGFHPHYVSESRSPHLADLVNNGLSTPFIIPSFPTQTFPNHWTLATGLYPINHGIVGNTFWDPIMKRMFQHTSEESLYAPFWGGESLWATARKNNRKSAVHMWPGSEVRKLNSDPDYVDPFNKSEELFVKRDRLMYWLDLPIEERPELLMAYVPTVDTAGHEFGISGDKVVEAIHEVDNFVGEIISGLADRNLTDIVNLVVVSDHGMAPTSDDRLVFLDDYIDTSRVKLRQGWPLAGLRYDYEDEIEPALEALRQGINSGAQVLKSDEMPKEWHFSTAGKYGKRLAPFYVVPDIGWSILTHEEYREMGEKYNLPGVHGYDNREALMRGFFAATGPEFPAGHYEPFENVNVYSLVCGSMGMKPAKTDGSANLIPLENQYIDFYPGVTFPIDYMHDSLFDAWPKSD